MEQPQEKDPATGFAMPDAPAGDPALRDEDGHEWASEGGATAQGAATHLAAADAADPARPRPAARP